MALSETKVEVGKWYWQLSVGRPIHVYRVFNEFETVHFTSLFLYVGPNEVALHGDWLTSVFYGHCDFNDLAEIKISPGGLDY